MKTTSAPLIALLQWTAPGSFPLKQPQVMCEYLLFCTFTGSIALQVYTCIKPSPIACAEEVGASSGSFCFPGSFVWFDNFLRAHNLNLESKMATAHLSFVQRCCHFSAEQSSSLHESFLSLDSKLIHIYLEVSSTESTGSYF